MGPRLFITYVNDLPDSIKNGVFYMYADDTTIYTTGNTTDEVAIALQVILDQLQTWCQRIDLLFMKGMRCSTPGYKTLYWPSEALSLGRQNH